ncbi:AraC family transcriptional regulator ligand-binding domain-containing protein [Streptomyces sp. NPDC046887]|uniref:AraC family transcriptional regulator n=1 Tax=Streptomyces sp. NPDC046887 TaxID=3155472 RepID=UPI0034052935
MASAGLLGIRPDAFAGLLGVAPEHLNDDRYRTPAATNVRIWDLMTARASWTEVAAMMARQSALGRLGAWDYLITSAPTPLQGLRDATDLLPAVADARTEALVITDNGPQIVVSHVNTAELAYDTASAIRAYSLGLLRQRLTEATFRQIVPVRVALTARAPREHRSLVDLYGTAAIDFESPVSSITFRAADLRTPLAHAQPGLSEVVRRQTEMGLTAAVPLRNWLDSFRGTLREVCAERTPSLSAVAGRLSVSPRTLQRRLDEHGTSWTAELELLRRTRTLELLRTTGLTLESIAKEGGYTDARTLRRAIHRWTGHTATALRGMRPPGAEQD